MTQIRPRIDDGLAAEVQAYADSYGISFADAIRILLRTGLQAATVPSGYGEGVDAILRGERARQEQDAGSKP